MRDCGEGAVEVCVVYGWLPGGGDSGEGGVAHGDVAVCVGASCVSLVAAWGVGGVEELCTVNMAGYDCDLVDLTEGEMGVDED